MSGHAITVDQFEFTDDSPLFRITVEDTTGKQREMLPVDFAERSESRRTEGRVLKFSADRLNVTVTLSAREAEVTGSVRVDSGGVLVREVRFPNITWTEVEAFDSLLMSTAWGDNIQRPTKVIRETKGGQISYVYPSELAMQYMALHNPGRSVYVSNYSLLDESFSLAAKSLGDRSLELSVVHHPFVRSGAWVSPECGFAVLTGGWHAAADLYSCHMRGKFAPPNLPDWMRESFHGWAQVGMSFVGGVVKHRFTDLPEVYRRISETGINTMHVFGWSGRGHDTDYPDYRPNPALGAEEDLRRAMDQIRSMGGHAILYTNGRLIDPDSQFCRENGGQGILCLREDGTPYSENYGTGVDFGVACPVCEEFHAHLASEVERIARQYHAHAIQIDQISCNPGYLCFNRSHPHPTPPTNFLPGVSALLRRVRHTHKAIDRDFFVWCEGCHERFGQFYDVNQGHGEEFTWQIGESTPEQFSYNYPDRIVTGISDTVQKLCYTYAQGKPFDFHVKALDDPEFARMLTELVAVRKSQPEHFERGVFKDCVGVEASAGARAFLIAGTDGTAMVNVWIPGLAIGGQASASIRLRGGGGIRKPIYPRNAKIRSNGEWWDLNWTGPVVSVLI